MQDLDNAGCCSEVLFVRGQFQKCFRGALVQKRIQKFLIGINQRIKFSRHCKNHMEIGGINDFRFSGINPDFLKDSLTVGAVPVAAGIIVDLHMPAISTLGNVAAKRATFAGGNGMCSFPLDYRKLERRCIRIPSGVKYLLYLTAHAHLP